MPIKPSAPFRFLSTFSSPHHHHSYSNAYSVLFLSVFTRPISFPTALPTVSWANTATKWLLLDNSPRACVVRSYAALDVSDMSSRIGWRNRHDLSLIPYSANLCHHFSFVPPVFSSVPYLIPLIPTPSHPGSGENHTVYFYKRSNPLCVPPPTAVRVLIPGRVEFAEDDEEVVCDPAFLETIKLAVGPVEGGKNHCDTLTLCIPTLRDHSLRILVSLINHFAHLSCRFTHSRRERSEELFDQRQAWKTKKSTRHLWVNLLHVPSPFFDFNACADVFWKIQMIGCMCDCTEGGGWCLAGTAYTSWESP